MWDTNDRYAALYDLWITIIDDETDEPTNVVPIDDTFKLSAIDLSAITTIKESSAEQVLDCPFPECVSLDILVINSSK